MPQPGGVCRPRSRDLDVTSGTGLPLAVRKRLEREGHWEYVRKSRARQLGWPLGHWAVHYGGGGPRTTGAVGRPALCAACKRWYAGTIVAFSNGHLRPNPAC